MRSSNCETHLQNIFDPTNFGLKLLWDPKIFFNPKKDVLSYKHICWTNKNSGLTIFASKIFWDPQFSLYLKIFELKTYQWPTNCFFQKVFGGPSSFLGLKTYSKPKSFWVKIIFGTKQFLGPNVVHGNKKFFDSIILGTKIYMDLYSILYLKFL